MNKSQIYKIKDIKNKNYLFENNDNSEILFLYQLLTNDILYIENINYLNIIKKTLIFLADGLFIIHPNTIKNTIQFIGIIKIYEEYY